MPGTGSIRCIWIFAGRKEGVKRHCVVENGFFSVLSVSISSKALGLRPIMQYYLIPHWFSTKPKTNDLK